MRRNAFPRCPPIGIVSMNAKCLGVLSVTEDWPHSLPLGPDGLLIRFSDRLSDEANRAALAFHAALIADLPDGVVETATSLTSVFVRFRPDRVSRAELEAALRTRLRNANWMQAPLPEGRRRWHLPVSFGGRDGPDLEDIANAAGLDTQQAITELCAAELRVLALGFAPGQPYLGFLPEHWNIPRRTEVTPQVPRGAVVVAVRQVIPFANPAPTGWRQAGRTSFLCFDPLSEPALPLRAGDSVVFEPVDAGKLEKLIAVGAPYGGVEAEEIS